jgi:predicted HTH transcriptional regulator
MTSFLNIAMISGLVSNMNSSIIISEITALIEYLKKHASSATSSAGYILSDTFFSTDTTSDTGTKGHGILSKLPDSAGEPKSKVMIVKDKKDSRKNSIISILKKDSQLTIKDFVKVINDCSEKTIQRELIDLVEKGIVKRSGERRWSTYSLA